MTTHASLPAAAVARVKSSFVPKPHAASLRPLQIALVSEGCYPFHPGGVSLWCHQLIQGMPENSFTAVALTVDGTEKSTWSGHDNLAAVVNIPLWGPRRRRRCVPPTSFTRHYEALLHSMFQPMTPECDAACVDEFIEALSGLYEYAQEGDLTSALARNESLDLLGRAWHEARLDSGRPGSAGPLSLRDAFVATDNLEHLLRPLSHPPVRADVCHLAMNGESVLVGLASKWAYGTPIALSEHGVYLRERYLSLAGEDASQPVKIIMMRFARRLAVAAYRSADILAPHSSYNRRWQLYGGADPARMRTMYNGVNPDDFPIAQGEPDVPTIVFVGRIDPLKDLHTLIRAFAIVRARIPDARLRMFGPVSKANEKYHASCVQLINELGLSDSATLEGPIARQVDAYQAGHLVALTSVSEGFPFTVVESMAMGRPQVCTNVGGVSEAVGKEVGFIVPPRDHAAVAEACIRLLEDADLRRSCGTLARQRVLERFTLDQWTNAYRDIYAELVPAVPDPTAVPAREGRPPVQWIFDPDKGTLTPAPYARIARELAEAAHSQSPDADGPNPDDRSGVVPAVHSERAVGASAPLTAADREGMAETAVIRRPLNGTSSQEDDEDTCVVQMIHAHRLVGASAPPAKARHDEVAATAAEPADESAAQPVVQP